LDLRADADAGRRNENVISPRSSHTPSAPVRAFARHSGFTVLEVLVALAVFAMAAIVLASSYLNILNGYEVIARGTESNADLAFARSVILNEADRTKLEQGGQFDTPDGNRMTWSVEIASTNMPELFTVTLSCETSDTPQHPSEKNTQTFTVLRPTWVVDVAERDKLRADVKQRITDMQEGKKQ
jgi:general secretion pathway protein I